MALVWNSDSGSYDIVPDGPAPDAAPAYVPPAPAAPAGVQSIDPGSIATDNSTKNQGYFDRSTGQRVYSVGDRYYSAADTARLAQDTGQGATVNWGDDNFMASQNPYQLAMETQGTNPSAGGFMGLTMDDIATMARMAAAGYGLGSGLAGTSFAGESSGMFTPSSMAPELDPTGSLADGTAQNAPMGGLQQMAQAEAPQVSPELDQTGSLADGTGGQQASSGLGDGSTQLASIANNPQVIEGNNFSTDSSISSGEALDHVSQELDPTGSLADGSSQNVPLGGLQQAAGAGAGGDMTEGEAWGSGLNMGDVNQSGLLGDAGLNVSGPSMWDSIMDKASSAADWMEKHKALTSMGLGLTLGGLQAYGNSLNQKKNQQNTDQLRNDRIVRQSVTDNPPPYTGMNGPGIRRPAFNPIDLAGLNRYGTRGEHSFYPVAQGGMPMSHSPRPMGAFETLVHGEGGGQEDNVPAMLSAKEYVMDADTVSALGDGNPDEGAKRLDRMRERIRAHKRGASIKKIPPKAHDPMRYLEAA